MNEFVFEGPEEGDEIPKTPADIVWGEWNFCTCGNPEFVMRTVRDALRGMMDRADASDDEAGQKTELAAFPADKSAHIVIRYLMAAADLTEHGGSVWGAWLTEKGRELLGFLEGTDEEGWFNA